MRIYNFLTQIIYSEIEWNLFQKCYKVLFLLHKNRNYCNGHHPCTNWLSLVTPEI